MTSAEGVTEHMAYVQWVPHTRSLKHNAFKNQGYSHGFHTRTGRWADEEAGSGQPKDGPIDRWSKQVNGLNLY